MDLAPETEALLARFPNTAVNADEQQGLRAGLYRPLFDLPQGRTDLRSRYGSVNRPRLCRQRPRCAVFPQVQHDVRHHLILRIITVMQ